MPTSTQAKSHWDHANLSIVGLGLLGASLAEAARRKWPLIKITGISSIATIEKALQAKIIDRGFNYTEIDLACADADLIILCTPIDSILKTLEKWTFNRLLCKPNCIITDVGSTKQEICLAGEKAFDGAPGIFIGSHPMAGSEKTGLDARDPLLFQNASWVICLPSDLGGVDSSGENSSGKNYPSEAASLLEIFAKGLGARTTIMSPSLHDQVTAHVSHLPQLLATALASFIGSQKNVVDNCLQIAGGGFRDMTRLAASAFSVWEPILRSNQNQIGDVLKEFQNHLKNLSEDLPKNYSVDFFQEGNGLRQKLSKARKGFSEPLMEILVDLEDRPGTLLQCIEPITKAQINILDIEVLKVREGEGGTMMMGFHDLMQANEALRILKQAGFSARLR